MSRLKAYEVMIVSRTGVFVEATSIKQAMAKAMQMYNDQPDLAQCILENAEVETCVEQVDDDER